MFSALSAHLGLSACANEAIVCPSGALVERAGNFSPTHPPTLTRPLETVPSETDTPRVGSPPPALLRGLAVSKSWCRLRNLHGCTLQRYRAQLHPPSYPCDAITHSDGNDAGRDCGFIGCPTGPRPSILQTSVLWNTPLHSWTGVASEAVNFLVPLSNKLPHLGVVGGYSDGQFSLL